MDLRKKQRVVLEALEDIKGRDIVVFNTARMPSMLARGDRERRLDAPGQGARRPGAGESQGERRAHLRRRGRSEWRVGAGRPRRRGGAHHASDGARFLQSGGSLGREDSTGPAQKTRTPWQGCTFSP